ncbi:serpin B4-like [Amyelois transitella]|uniref:serpin B4-like n=1 Tax=Amyelois transitella TaxID=680683 RepID=UPI00298F6F86|nr:serpin B4-like [Amyelois transitella]
MENIPKLEDTEIQQINFKNEDFRKLILFWANQQAECKENIDTYLTSKNKNLFLNTCTLKGKWKSTVDGKTPEMKIYNSFNYTQDIKYEARLLELPLHDDDMKLVLTVPNEHDTLSTLVATLANNGLGEAINSIRPLFTACTVLTAPDVKFNSELRTTIDDSKATIQYGDIDINENGVSAKVLTCLFTPNNGINPSHYTEEQTQPSYFFAVTFKGTAILTGNFIPS